MTVIKISILFNHQRSFLLKQVGKSPETHSHTICSETLWNTQYWMGCLHEISSLRAQWALWREVESMHRPAHVCSRRVPRAERWSAHAPIPNPKATSDRLPLTPERRSLTWEQTALRGVPMPSSRQHKCNGIFGGCFVTFQGLCLHNMASGFVFWWDSWVCLCYVSCVCGFFGLFLCFFCPKWCFFLSYCTIFCFITVA